MQIVFISGYLQSGKDTVGDILCRHLSFKRYSFAEKLKDEVAEMHNFSRSSLDTTHGKRDSVRRLLIDHGMKRRDENINHWVEKLWEQIEIDNCSHLVITDWRFPNELAEITRRAKSAVIVTIRVNRWSQPPLFDPSELALDDFDFDHVIQNQGMIKELRRSVRDVAISANIAHAFVTDVDDTLLEWSKHFCDSDHNSLSQLPNGGNQLKDRVRQFNRSTIFSKLDPLPGAVETLKRIKNIGGWIIAVTSCETSDFDDVTTKLRLDNLQRCFGDVIDEIVIFPLWCPKKIDVVECFYVDDDIMNLYIRRNFEGVGSDTLCLFSKTKVSVENVDVVCEWEDVWQKFSCYVKCRS
jgi:hypothetical protein